MKALIGAAAAALLLASPAAAQAQTQPAVTANCSGFEATPTGLPDGATANASRMNQGRERVAEWLRARDARLAQCLADINAQRAQLNAIEAAYNQAVTEKEGVVNGWAVETEEYNARGGSASSSSSSTPARRERGSVLTRPN